MWDLNADQFADKANNMQRVADELDRVSEPLFHVIRPVRDLNTTSTWDGNAAIQSRRRLDIHQDRTNATLRTVDRLADDLRSDARIATYHSSQARDRQHDARRTAARIEIELGRLRNIDR